ncbi:MAG TPA: D-alanine--D-alanine ligase family protein [Steroidobacteraceae bacterium]|nr:D-alanine--D-alanine ligase family protein [Steroidobacteraceae bacterium]
MNIEANRPASLRIGQKTAQKARVAIVYGGQSAEHEISILSARYVVEALDRKRFEPVLLGIDKQGHWLKQSETGLLASTRNPKDAALERGAPINPLLLAASSPSSASSNSDDDRVEIVFPVVHGTRGEDGAMQGLLELAGIPYVGSGVLGSAIGMDKDITKRLLIEAGIPVARFMTFRKHEFAAHPLTTCRKAACLGFPLFAKPANLGSSVGVSKVSTRKQLNAALAYAFQFDDKVIVEERIVGREIECAILGGEKPHASAVGEIVVNSRDGFYSYAAKYLDPDGARLDVPAQLDRTTTARVQRLALRAFQALECYGLARVDFFLTPNGSILVNEINTLPGFTAISMYPKLWEKSGVAGAELVTRLLELALARHKCREERRMSPDYGAGIE